MGASRFAPYAGLLLDAPQWPAKPAEREDLLSFFFVQDIAHSTESKSPPSSMSCRFYWPVLRCPSLAGFGCPPRCLLSLGCSRRNISSDVSSSSLSCSYGGSSYVWVRYSNLAHFALLIWPPWETPDGKIPGWTGGAKWSYSKRSGAILRPERRLRD